MKKDKRTKAQLLEEIKRLENEISAIFDKENGCRKATFLEGKLSKELHEANDDRNLFKDSLKFILRNVKH